MVIISRRGYNPRWRLPKLIGNNSHLKSNQFGRLVQTFPSRERIQQRVTQRSIRPRRHPAELLRLQHLQHDWPPGTPAALICCAAERGAAGIGSHSAAGSCGNAAPRGGMCWHGHGSCSPSSAGSGNHKTLSPEIFSCAGKKAQKLASYFQLVLSSAPPAPWSASLQDGNAKKTHLAFFFVFFLWLTQSLSIRFICFCFSGEGRYLGPLCGAHKK